MQQMTRSLKKPLLEQVGFMCDSPTFNLVFHSATIVLPKAPLSVFLLTFSSLADAAADGANGVEGCVYMAAFQ
jgi:hypothetical protein